MLALSVQHYVAYSWNVSTDWSSSSSAFWTELHSSQRGGGGLNTEVFKGGLVLSHLDAAADAGPESQLVSTPAALETRGGLMEARWACRLQRFPPRRLRVSADRRHISSFWFVLHWRRFSRSRIFREMTYWSTSYWYKSKLHFRPLTP